MGRLRIGKEKQAKSVPISLGPKHIRMLTKLGTFLDKGRSRLIQLLIEKAYNELIKGDEDERRASRKSTGSTRSRK